MSPSSMVRRRSGLYVPRAGGGAGYSAAVLADNPLAYYRHGEASGTTMVDSSGNGHHGAYVGSPTLGASGLVTGDTDTAVTLNGSSQYGQNTFGSWLNVNTITLEALIKCNSGGPCTFLDRDGLAGVRTFIFQIGGSKLGFYMFLTTGSLVVVTGTTTLTTGTKYHAAASYDGTTAKVYLNGALDGSTAASGTLANTATCPLSVGVQYEPTGGTQFSSFFTGTLDESAYYGSALSATRIAAHAAAA